MKRMLALLLVLCLCLTALPVTAHAADTDPEAADRANSWRYAEGQWLGANAHRPRYTAYHPDATLIGIDVSAWQGSIDWQAVKDDGIDFVILRCGFGMDQEDQDDKTFLYNASECERVGLPYGVYLYSYANSVARADSEADHVLRLLQGRKLSLPVYYDMEDESTLTDEEGKPTDLAAIATTFCDKIAKAGYPVGVYANLYWWSDLLTDPCFDKWHRWVAQYNVSCGYQGDFAMWQFSATGAVAGINGNVDMNYLIGYPDDHNITPNYSLIRLSGDSRYATANAIADAVGTQQGTDKFDSIIIACGTAFPDALSGSYLAAVKGAPILITNGKTSVPDEKDAENPDWKPAIGSIQWAQGYIQRNLKPDGTVYILGGEAAVPGDMETGLEGYKVQRLYGGSRYETNLAILNETGVGGKDILIASGTGFADSLSASASGLPLMLVGEGLTGEQLAMLVSGSGNFIIIGGTGAVSETVEAQLRELGTVERVYGNDRYLTSAAVAARFFPDSRTVTLACGSNFPDGLCGGPLAYGVGAPLLLVAAGKEGPAAAYRTTHVVKRALIFGGTGAVSDKTVNAVFGIEE